jgi:hypothetical protein
LPQDRNADRRRAVDPSKFWRLNVNKLLVAALAAIPLLAATPASARYQDRADAEIDGKISELQTRLRSGLESRMISRRQAMPLRAQLRDLTLIERAYRRDGFSRVEKTDVQQRLRRLEQQVRLADAGRGHRAARSAG